MEATEKAKQGTEQIVDDIVALSAAIAYAALTGRMEHANVVAGTLHKILHVATHTCELRQQHTPISTWRASSLAKEIAAEVAAALQGYSLWVLDDTDANDG